MVKRKRSKKSVFNKHVVSNKNLPEMDSFFIKIVYLGFY